MQQWKAQKSHAPLRGDAPIDQEGGDCNELSPAWVHCDDEGGDGNDLGEGEVVVEDYIGEEDGAVSQRGGVGVDERKATARRSAVE